MTDEKATPPGEKADASAAVKPGDAAPKVSILRPPSAAMAEKMAGKIAEVL